MSALLYSCTPDTPKLIDTAINMERQLRNYGTLCLIAILMVACNEVNSQQQKEVVEKKDTAVKYETTAENQHQCIADEPQGPIDPESEIFYRTEEMPEFPGGMDKMLQFIAENIYLPKCVIAAQVEGRSIIEFVVEKDGTLTDFNVIRSLNKECDEEAIRVLKTMPKWKPGMERGKPIRVKYTVPVVFRKHY